MKATITIEKGNFSTDGEGFVNGQEFIAVSFWGHNEGSSSPCLNEEEANNYIKQIQTQYKDKYTFEIIDKRIKQLTLNI